MLFQFRFYLELLITEIGLLVSLLLGLQGRLDLLQSFQKLGSSELPGLSIVSMDCAPDFGSFAEELVCYSSRVLEHCKIDKMGPSLDLVIR